MKTRLAVFDFDGTLVNTPEKPQAWKGGWWGKDHSLLPPFVPRFQELKEKGQHLLNQKVVDAYLLSKKCPKTHTVMMTGRHWGLSRTVMNILYGFGLCEEYDRHNLLEESNQFIFISGGNTLAGKLERLTELFKEFPEVVEVEMWEDRQEHIPHFREHAKVLGQIRSNFGGILIHEPPNWD
jgi:hypothetical protein